MGSPGRTRAATGMRRSSVGRLFQVTVDSAQVAGTVARFTSLLPVASPLSLRSTVAPVTMSPATSPVTVNETRHSRRAPTSSLTKQLVGAAVPSVVVGAASDTYASAMAVKVSVVAASADTARTGTITATVASAPAARGINHVRLRIDFMRAFPLVGTRRGASVVAVRRSMSKGHARKPHKTLRPALMKCRPCRYRP